jgi:hypothetical protein
LQRSLHGDDQDKNLIRRHFLHEVTDRGDEVICFAASWAANLALSILSLKQQCGQKSIQFRLRDLASQTADGAENICH